MAPDAKPDVEVATIKPTQPGTRLFMITVRGEDVLVKNFSLSFVVRWVYQLHPRQIIGAQGWMDTDKWDIEAKPDTPGMPDVEQEKEILRKLMTERFAMKIHEEKREMPAYTLTVSKDGPKMMKAADAGLSPSFAMGPLGVVHVQSATMDDFAHMLNDILDRPVVNETGLTGKWDFVLKWTPDETQFAGAPVKVSLPPASAEDANAPPPLFRAIQDQLDLKLNAQKVQVPVVVIDHVAHPSPN